jgi:hypothetical protein
MSEVRKLKDEAIYPTLVTAVTAFDGRYMATWPIRKLFGDHGKTQSIYEAGKDAQGPCP